MLVRAVVAVDALLFCERVVMTLCVRYVRRPLR